MLQALPCKELCKAGYDLSAAAKCPDEAAKSVAVVDDDLHAYEQKLLKAIEESEVPSVQEPPSQNFWSLFTCGDQYARAAAKATGRAEGNFLASMAHGQAYKGGHVSESLEAPLLTDEKLQGA
eukprot:gnl/TRDRNA2_/TRDRNA2_174099_c0_seq8.p1 gnl/TRDRNA2_/TRDRNA2_174099_c0~~gnl/TRDRNA2_/TRDRNA2_174099_c0_seq8.p1  ORF type:complete len:123 (-),score=32.91 gnl/TRDRNA2_/TRDRNA2_174099_c0_seq8:334-702(-)